MVNIWLLSDDGQGTEILVFAHDRCPWAVSDERFQNLKTGWYWHRAVDDDTGTLSPETVVMPSGPFAGRGEAANDAAKCCFD